MHAHTQTHTAVQRSSASMRASLFLLEPPFESFGDFTFASLVLSLSFPFLSFFSFVRCRSSSLSLSRSLSFALSLSLSLSFSRFRFALSSLSFSSFLLLFLSAGGLLGTGPCVSIGGIGGGTIGGLIIAMWFGIIIGIPI